MNKQDAAGCQRSRAGRPLKPVDGDEPGRAYVNALRRWPKIAGFNSAELANRLNISQGAVSRTLSNRRNWKASQNLLLRACKIIDVCGGTETDQENWKTYHQEVDTYQAMGGTGPAPTPPEIDRNSLALREFVVNKRGAVLDRDRRVIDEVVPGDVVQVRSLDTGPYHARYEATLHRTGTVGWVNQAGLQYQRTIPSTEFEPPLTDPLRLRPSQAPLAVREYVVKKHGAVLDRDSRVIDRVVPGDVVQVRSLDTGPYHARYEATLHRTGTVGWVNQAGLQYQRTIKSSELEPSNMEPLHWQP